MFWLFKNRKGQSATEVAILGSLVILAFSYLITLTAKINAQQLHIQKTFREVRDAARDKNTSASATGKLKYTRLPNITNPYEPGELILLSSSGSVDFRSGRGNSALSINQTEDDKYSQAANYKVTFTRTETSGSYPETHRKVTFPGFPALDKDKADQP